MQLQSDLAANTMWVEHLDSATGEWHGAEGALLTPRHMHSCTQISGKLFVLGGRYGLSDKTSKRCKLPV